MPETWLIRHAQSTANAGLPTESPAASPLTDLGHEQATLLAHSIDQAPDLIVTSPYARTLQTAQPLLDRYPHSAHETWSVQEFNYLNASKYQGTSSAERRPASQAYWEALDPNYEDGPGAESFVAFMVRVTAFVENIKARDGRTIVFTHGKFIRGCIWRLFMGQRNGAIDVDEAMLGFRHFRSSFRLANTAVIKVSWEEEDPCISAMRLAHLNIELATF